MTDGKHKALRITAIVILIMSVAIQMLYVIFSWWSFDPQLSCDGVIYWGEWIACLHASHPYILVAEGCVATWVVAGIGLPLGRFLPPYISAILLVGLTVALIWFLQAQFRSHTTPYFGGVLVFAVSITAVFLAGPMAGAWLWGLARRGRRRSLLRLSAVFDSAR